MDSEQIFVGIAVIVGVAVVCQIVAERLRLPALIFLLPAGFFAGVLVPSANAIDMLGDVFSPLVNLTVAVILFHGGAHLHFLPLDREDKGIVRRLVWIGSLITWGIVGLAAWWLLDLPANIAALLGAILIVSGPTVVTPLLDFIIPRRRIRRILLWEGTMIDPVGALIAVIAFSGVQAASQPGVMTGFQRFGYSLLIGALAAAIGIGLIWLGLKIVGDNSVLATQVLLGSAIVTAALADSFADDSGLVAAVLCGLATPLILGDDLKKVMPFFETTVKFSIGILFVAISALVTPDSLGQVWLPSLAIVALIVFVVRPGSVFLLTAGSTLTWKERLFIGWMAPKGIVAAASAASFSTTLVAMNVEGADKLLPATFLVIAGTVIIYSITAAPMAHLTGVKASEQPQDIPDDRVASSP